jgi:hypothetical protein
MIDGLGPDAVYCVDGRGGDHSGFPGHDAHFEPTAACNPDFDAGGPVGWREIGVGDYTTLKNTSLSSAALDCIAELWNANPSQTFTVGTVDCMNFDNREWCDKGDDNKFPQAITGCATVRIDSLDSSGDKKSKGGLSLTILSGDTGGGGSGYTRLVR